VARGQLEVLGERQPVDRLLPELAAEPGADAARLAGQLAESQAVLAFAARELALPVGNRYRSYVDLDRPYVIWNVFAAPELSLEPHEWCYPIAGCAPYRGYFAEREATRMRERLAARGLDTYIGGVPAYSTLGRFDDPLLSTFIDWPRRDLAELLLHELAHGVVWVQGDVAFNESFATFVGSRGADEWMVHAAGPDYVRGAEDDGAAWRRFTALLALTRERLDAVYRSPVGPAERRAAKRAVIAAAQACHAEHRDLFGAGRYDGFMTGLNNAALVSVATYEDLVPAFAQLFAALGGDWPAFYASVSAMAEVGAEERRARLERLLASGDDQVADDADDEDAHDVQCEALDGHVPGAEPAGAEHDDIGRGGHG
jgi:predicted aminopeptidase